MKNQFFVLALGLALALLVPGAAHAAAPVKPAAQGVGMSRAQAERNLANAADTVRKIRKARDAYFFEIFAEYLPKKK